MEQEVMGKDVRRTGTFEAKKQMDISSVKMTPTAEILEQKKGLSDAAYLKNCIAWAALPYQGLVDEQLILQEASKNIFDGIAGDQIYDALILSTIVFVELEPAYGYVAARLLLKKLHVEVCGEEAQFESEQTYRASFISAIKNGIEQGVLDPRMSGFDLNYLASHLKIERDTMFDFMGLRVLYERYFLQSSKRRLELPQAFWMRVAMGICYNEPNKNERAVEFYNVFSEFNYVSGTPTLLHSGLMRPQLSSCFLTTVEDDLKHIFKCYSDNAQLSKWSGGVANDWTNVRATGALVKSIQTESQGVVPFLKIVSDITAAINRSGKRRGATCVYLETWHYEIEDFLDLRRNTGDERRRTHDINTANWVPDLFMKRVLADADWTLFSPEETPDLHHLYGKAFELRYEWYEQQAKEGNIALFKVIPAKQLWRKMLSRLFETGHPWITFKDPANIRSPQDHVGVIHSSNLCTEILLNTSADETAVCNLGSINIGQHVIDGVLDKEKIAQTIRTAIRMLDNVIDINFYPTKEAETANMRHRPIGLGLMGFQDALYKMDISFESPNAVAWTDELMELISYNTILASSILAKERGTYASYKGSKWDRGIFPQDTIDMLEKERGMKIATPRGGKLDWTPVREHVKQYGMRNSHTMAIAPTATISNIVGCFPCIEPIYKNIYVKANMSGEFTIVNKYLIQDLKELGLWSEQMLELLKYYDGNIQMIAAIPDRLKAKYKEAFEIDPLLLLSFTEVRGKWIDQSQSHNVFMKGTSGKMLHDIYMGAWQMGIKTTYYLRSLGASQIEKSTLDASKFGFTQKRTYDVVTDPALSNGQEAVTGKTCSIMTDPDCEVCQ